MAAIGLSILAAFGFASSAVLARQGMEAIGETFSDTFANFL